MSLANLADAITTVVEYNWAKELDDYRDHEESRQGHIFIHLVELDRFVSGRPWEPEDFLLTESCPKCGRPTCKSEAFEDEGEGDEAGRTFYYCSEHCREAH